MVSFINIATIFGMWSTFERREIHKLFLWNAKAHKTERKIQWTQWRGRDKRVKRKNEWTTERMNKWNISVNENGSLISVEWIYFVVLMHAYVFSLVLCRISGTSIFIIMIFCSFQPRLILIISIFRFSLRVRFQFRCYFFILFCFVRFWYCVFPHTYIWIVTRMVSLKSLRTISCRMRGWDCFVFILYFFSVIFKIQSFFFVAYAVRILLN